VRGTAASLSMIRTCFDGVVEEQERTWIWRLVAKGQILWDISRRIAMFGWAYFDEMKDRCFGMRSNGRSPDSENVVRFIAGSTGVHPAASNEAEVDLQSMNMVSCVKSMYLPNISNHL